jgi:hypothetical protein
MANWTAKLMEQAKIAELILSAMLTALFFACFVRACECYSTSVSTTMVPMPIVKSWRR